jgi:cytochrome c-type biogenesis protein CcmH
MYNYNGAYQQLSQPLNTANQQAHNNIPQEDQAQQMITHIKSLIDLTRAEPDNADAWFGLGQAFISIGEFSKAGESFDKVIGIEGETAELLGAKAQAYYYRDNQTLTNDVQQLIDQALRLDATDASTNILLGMHNFINQHYNTAIKHWETVINSNKTNVDTQALSEAVAEARKRLQQVNLGNNGQQANNGQSTQPPTNNKQQVVSGPQITVNVDMSETIKNQLIQGDDKTVFIYAVSADAKHGRMPVAAVKLKASDLPVTVVLDDSKAMTPQAKISDVPAIHIYAVISASGSVGIKSGDFKAESLNTDVLLTEPVSLLIDTIVP